MTNDFEFIGMCTTLINEFIKNNMDIQFKKEDLKILSINTLTDVYQTLILYEPTKLVFEILRDTNSNEEFKVCIYGQIGHMSAHVEKENNDIHLEGDCWWQANNYVHYKI